MGRRIIDYTDLVAERAVEEAWVAMLPDEEGDDTE